jgi:hypothetical protein
MRTEIKNIENAITNDCFFLLLSCDKNKDLVDQNLMLLQRYWPNLPFQVFVMLEKADVSFKNATTINTSSQYWTARLLQSLKIINKKYVLLSCDDFWIEETVDLNEVLRSLHEMESNQLIVNISFSHMKNASSSVLFDHFRLRTLTGHSLVNFQMGLWKVSSLEKLLKANEDPWEAELIGTERAKRYKDNLFACVDCQKNSPIVYNNGWLVVRGEWNSLEVKRLEKKLGLSIDVSSRRQKPINGVIPEGMFSMIRKKMKIFLAKMKYSFFFPKEPL